MYIINNKKFSATYPYFTHNELAYFHTSCSFIHLCVVCHTYVMSTITLVLGLHELLHWFTWPPVESIEAYSITIQLNKSFTVCTQFDMLFFFLNF